jgi:hypothetical protein
VEVKKKVKILKKGGDKGERRKLWREVEIGKKHGSWGEK